MISFIEGKIEYIGDRFVIINAGGIGYKVVVSQKVLDILSNKQDKVKAQLFVHSQLNMREGTFDLYGFDKKENLDLFSLLISVSGIGPKNAMGILAVIEPDDLQEAIVAGNAAYLRKISGIGLKTAQRLVLELKNKIEYLPVGGEKRDLVKESQAVDALLALGYNQNQARDALKEVPTTLTSLQDRVREALKALGKR